MRTIIYLSIIFCFTVQHVHAFEWPHIQPKKIGQSTYVIEHGPHDEDHKISHGFHNNPGFIITDTGVVVVDTGSSYEISKMILRKIAAVTDKPVTHIFTTHIHGDHWLGNQALVEKYPDVKTIAHPKLIELLNAGEDKFWLERFSERLGDAFVDTKVVIPSTAAEAKEYKIGGKTFNVMLFDQAHTATDLMVHVVEDDVLFTGDIVNNEHFSFMGHGNFKGAYEATAKVLEINPETIVAGHGKSGGIELAKKFNYLYGTLRTEVARYYDEGLMDYEMKPEIAARLADYEDWSGFDEQLGRYISQVVQEIEKELF